MWMIQCAVINNILQLCVHKRRIDLQNIIYKYDKYQSAFPIGN